MRVAVGVPAEVRETDASSERDKVGVVETAGVDDTVADDVSEVAGLVEAVKVASDVGFTDLVTVGVAAFVRDTV